MSSSDSSPFSSTSLPARDGPLECSALAAACFLFVAACASTDTHNARTVDAPMQAQPAHRLANERSSASGRSSIATPHAATSEPDARLASELRTTLIRDPDLPSLAKDVGISVDAGYVTLRGIVQSAGDKGRVAEIVLGIAGVKSVDNRVEVRESAARYRQTKEQRS